MGSLTLRSGARRLPRYPVVVCHCRVVSDRAVRAAVSAGACDVDEVASLCGAGGACGGCVPTIEELLADAGTAVRHPERLRERQHRRRVAASPVSAPA